MNTTIKMLPGECWYGLATIHGTKFPLNETSEYSWHPTQDFTGNQESPILLSSLGRYLWSEFPYDVDVSQGLIRITNAADDLILSEGHGTLRGAFLPHPKIISRPMVKSLLRTSFSNPSTTPGPN